MSFELEGQPRAKKIRSLADLGEQPEIKDPLELPLTENFDLFIKEGNIFDVRDKSRKLQKFIPKSPDDGLDQSFGSDSFGINSARTSEKITKRFFDF